MSPLRDTRPKHILDLDVETVAAGFADPDWVPQKITCVAWSWIDEEQVQSRICMPQGIFGQPARRAKMLAPLLDAIAEADMITGHNVIRFDLPIINSECMRLGLQPVTRVLVQDTIRVLRSKGFKKGQDSISRLLRVPAEKLALDWQAWQDAYDERYWETIRERCESDVRQHKLMRAEMLERGWLKAPTIWRS